MRNLKYRLIEIESLSEKEMLVLQHFVDVLWTLLCVLFGFML